MSAERKHTRAVMRDEYGAPVQDELRTERKWGSDPVRVNIQTANATLRADEDTSAGNVIEMLALPFGDVYETRFFSEEFDPGAFDQSLREIEAGDRDVFIFNSHDSSQLLASTAVKEGPGSVRFRVDSEGLKARITLAETTLGADVYNLVRTGVLNGASVGYFSREYEVIEAGDSDRDKTHYIEKSVDLVETSFTPIPAYSETTTEVASREVTTKDPSPPEPEEDDDDIDPPGDVGILDAPTDDPSELSAIDHLISIHKITP